MGKKENFGQAMYEMFGVGKQHEEQQAPVQEEQVKPAAETEQQASVKPAEPVKVEKPVEQPRVKSVTYLAPGTSMQGTLTTDGDVEVAGKFQGDIVAEGEVKLRSDICGNITANQLQILSCNLTGDVVVSGGLVVDENSHIHGDVKVKQLFCAGKIEGNITVEENAEFASKAQVKGDIATKTMVMACGARIEGKVQMGV